MNILCLFLAFFTLSPYIYILLITLEHERKLVSLQVQYPYLKRWNNFSSQWMCFSLEKTVSGLSIKVNWTFWASFLPSVFGDYICRRNLMQNKAWRAKIPFLKNLIYLCNVYYYLTLMYIICRQHPQRWLWVVCIRFIGLCCELRL